MKLYDSINIESEGMEVSPKISQKTLSDLKSRLLPAILLIVVGFTCLFVNKYLFAGLCSLALAGISYEVFFCVPGKFLPLKTLTFCVCSAGIFMLSFCRFTFGPEICLYLISATIGADTGGYAFGKMFGGPKLCPAISPNKTVSGFIGALLLANIFCFTCVKLLGLFIPFWVTQLVILSAVLGDLLESKVKRTLGIKDFGKCFAGHGGVLDRFDSLIMASIMFVLCYLR